jgi:DNA-binding GntR family transcriptional regulator
LAASLGISRTPVREALASLAREGLVVIRPQSGSFVVTLDVASVRALCQMRAVLECGALRLASSENPERLAAAVSKQIAGGALAVEAKDAAQAEMMDSAFHRALVDSAGNPLLTQAYQAIAYKLEAIRHRLPHDLVRMRRAVDQHRRVLDLAITGQVREAEEELAAHVRSVEQLTIMIIGSSAERTTSGGSAMVVA